MNKRLLQKLITVSILSTLAAPVFAGVDYDAGMNAYNKGDFNFAKILFQKAIKVNYYDVNARYMYCQILVKEKKYDAAKSEYQNIIKIAPSSQAASFAKQGITNIDAYNKRIAEEAAIKGGSQSSTNGQVQKSSQNQTPTYTATEYVKNAYRGGKKYLRPLGMVRVYIEPNSTFKPMMVQAYKEWQSALGSSVMFTFSGNEADASDVVTFIKHNGGQGMQEGGNCQYNIQGDTLVGNKITIRVYYPNGKQLPNEVIYHTMLHEIGHSIGIMGHSPYQGDVMAQGAAKFVPHLTDRDKNTARLLYKNYGKQPEKQDIQKAKTAELTDIAKRIPNDPSSLIDLGDEAMAAYQFHKAIEYYKKAEAIRQNKDICFRQIKAYKALQDNDNIAACYKKILTLDKGNIIAINNLLVMYQQQGRYIEGKKILDEFIANNPNLANNTDILNLKAVFSERNAKKMEAREKLLNKTRTYGYR